MTNLDELATRYQECSASLREAETSVKTLRAATVDALCAFQSACPHPVDCVLQGESVGIVAPFRVCSACGYAEQGWGAGYTRLRECHDHNIVARPAAMLCVRGGVIPNHLHVKGSVDDPSRPPLCEARGEGWARK